MKNRLFKLLGFLFLLLFFLNFTSLTAYPSHQNESSMINTSYQRDITLYYNNYDSFGIGEAYTFTGIVWNFSSLNNTKITVLAMDYLNFKRFDYNFSSYQSYTLSDGTKSSDTGIFNFPYDDYWMIIFFNNDSTSSRTDIYITLDDIMNPFIFIMLPIILCVSIVLLYVGISIYYKRIKQENNIGGTLCIFINFLFGYIFAYFFIIPYYSILT